MKKFMPYAVVFLLASGTAAVMVLVLLLMKPGMIPAPAALPADSLRAAERARTTIVDAARQNRETAQSDSTQRESRLPVSPAETPGAVGASGSTESAVAAGPKASAPAAERVRSTMESTLNVTAGADSVQEGERKSMAKVLEAMDPASAAKILNDFPDDDVKQIILTIKRRQAAKILAALDPDRAARIMR
jgi:flagellar motility protein MotE (MotC chaperone)